MAIFPNRLNSPIEFKDRQFIHVTNWSKFVPSQEFSLDVVIVYETSLKNSGVFLQIPADIISFFLYCTIKAKTHVQS